jgi:prolyl-tRNA synthetase
MGTVVEVLSDDKGIIWPEAIAPFAVHLLVLGEDKAVRDEAEKTFKILSDKGVEVLFDDRSEVTPGEKFADADLLGMPYRVVVSTRSMKDGGVELKKRTEEKGKMVTVEELISLLATRN